MTNAKKIFDGSQPHFCWGEYKLILHPAQIRYIASLLGGEIFIDFIKLGNYLPQGRQENQEETEKEMKSRGEAEKEEPNPEK